MTYVNAALTTAVVVLRNITHVWYMAVGVIAGDSRLRSFCGSFTRSATKCRGRNQNISVRAERYIEPAGVADTTQLLCLVVIVGAGHSAFHIFGCNLSTLPVARLTRVPPVALLPSSL